MDPETIPTPPTMTNARAVIDSSDEKFVPVENVG